MKGKKYVIEDEDRNRFELFYSEKSIYNDMNRFLVSWWGTDSYFNNELIQISDIWIMTAEYFSSGSYVSIVRTKFIEHNTYTGRRSHFHSKPIPICGPVQKSDLNYSYSISHFSQLPPAVAKS